MPPADPLNDYEFAYGFPATGQGIKFGEGSNIEVDSIEGLHGYGSRDNDLDFFLNHGQIAGNKYLQSKIIRLNVEIRRGQLTIPNYVLLIRNWENYMTPPDKPVDQVSFGLQRLYYKFPSDGERYVECIPVRRERARNASTEYGLMPMRIDLKATDPRIYAMIDKSETLVPGGNNLPNNGSVRSYPKLVWRRPGSETGFTLTTSSDNGPSGAIIIQLAGLPANTNDIILDFKRWSQGFTNKLVYEDVGNGIDRFSYWVAPREPVPLWPGNNYWTTTADIDVLWNDAWL